MYVIIIISVLDILFFSILAIIVAFGMFIMIDICIIIILFIYMMIDFINILLTSPIPPALRRRLSLEYYRLFLFNICLVIIITIITYNICVFIIAICVTFILINYCIFLTVIYINSIVIIYLIFIILICEICIAFLINVMSLCMCMILFPCIYVLIIFTILMTNISIFFRVFRAINLYIFIIKVFIIVLLGISIIFDSTTLSFCHFVLWFLLFFCSGSLGMRILVHNINNASNRFLTISFV